MRETTFRQVRRCQLKIAVDSVAFPRVHEYMERSTFTGGNSGCPLERDAAATKLYAAERFAVGVADQVIFSVGNLSMS